MKKPGPEKPSRASLLDDDRAVQEVAPGAAEFLRQVGAQEPLRAGLAPQVAVDDAVALPAGVVRRNLLLDEAPHLLAEDVVLLAERRTAHGLDHRRSPVPFASCHSCSKSTLRTLPTPLIGNDPWRNETLRGHL